MKFELLPPNQQIPNKDLLNDLKRVAMKLKKDTVTKREYIKEGSFAYATVSKRFGTWFDALEKAGLSTTRQAPISEKACITDLRRVAKELNSNCVTVEDYKKVGFYSEQPFRRHFGSWTKALNKAGLKVSPHYKERISDLEYFANLEYLWRKFGRQPKYSEIQKPISKYSSGAYENRFGSWRKAIDAFINFMNSDVGNNIDKNNIQEETTENRSYVPNDKNEDSFKKIKKYRKQTSRTPSLRLRFLTMKRDNFKCQQCGRSPALEPGVILHVDHIIPWSKDGETTIANLQTLCEQCNLGKNNLLLES